MALRLFRSVHKCLTVSWVNIQELGVEVCYEGVLNCGPLNNLKKQTNKKNFKYPHDIKLVQSHGDKVTF